MLSLRSLRLNEHSISARHWTHSLIADDIKTENVPNVTSNATQTKSVFSESGDALISFLLRTQRRESGISFSTFNRHSYSFENYFFLFPSYFWRLKPDDKTKIIEERFSEITLFRVNSFTLKKLAHKTKNTHFSWVRIGPHFASVCIPGNLCACKIVSWLLSPILHSQDAILYVYTLRCSIGDGYDTIDDPTMLVCVWSRLTYGSVIYFIHYLGKIHQKVFAV